MITITISGFKTKKQAIEWLEQYEGSVEQCFDGEFPQSCVMESFMPEMQKFKDENEKNDFSLTLK